MITVYLKEEEFHNDVYALVRAFYPGEDTAVSVREDCPGITILLPDGDALTVEDSWSIRQMGRKDTKSEMKRLLYAALREKTGRQLPWGDSDGHPAGEDTDAASGGGDRRR